MAVRNGVQLSGAAWRSARGPAPSLLDPDVPPDEDRDRPGHQEQADDQEAEAVEVDAGDPLPRPMVEAEPVADEAEELDAADRERDDDRERADREVVIDPAYGLGERPPVGEGDSASGLPWYALIPSPKAAVPTFRWAGTTIAKSVPQPSTCSAPMSAAITPRCRRSRRSRLGSGADVRSVSRRR